jgi:hypothetical protein
MTVPRGSSRFRKNDVAKALDAATKAGLIVSRFEITAEGKIVVIAARSDLDESFGETSDDLRNLL